MQARVSHKNIIPRESQFTGPPQPFQGWGATINVAHVTGNVAPVTTQWWGHGVPCSHSCHVRLVMVQVIWDMVREPVTSRSLSLDGLDSDNSHSFWSGIMPEIAFKLLHYATWSGCAVLLESKQTPFSRIGHRWQVVDCCAALNRIQFRIWGFVHWPYLLWDLWIKGRLSNAMSDRSFS